MMSVGDCVEIRLIASPSAVLVGLITDTSGTKVTVRILEATRRATASWVPPILRVTHTTAVVCTLTHAIKLVLVLAHNIWHNKKLFFIKGATGVYSVLPSTEFAFGAALFQKPSATDTVSFLSALASHRALGVYHDRVSYFKKVQGALKNGQGNHSINVNVRVSTAFAGEFIALFESSNRVDVEASTRELRYVDQDRSWLASDSIGGYTLHVTSMQSIDALREYLGLLWSPKSSVKLKEDLREAGGRTCYRLCDPQEGNPLSVEFNTITCELRLRAPIEEINGDVALAGVKEDAVLFSSYVVYKDGAYAVFSRREEFNVLSRMKRGTAATHDQTTILMLRNLVTQEVIEVPEATITAEGQLASPLLGLLHTPRRLLIPSNEEVGAEVRHLLNELQRPAWSTVDQLVDLLKDEIKTWSEYYTMAVLESVLKVLCVPLEGQALTLTTFLDHIGDQVHSITKIPKTAERKRTQNSLYAEGN